MAQTGSGSDSWKHAGRGFWKQYINNTCTAHPAHRLQKLLGHLNGVELSIQFTVGGKAPLSTCTVEVRASIDKVDYIGCVADAYVDTNN